MTYKIRRSCRLCSFDKLTTVLDLGETALANEYPTMLGQMQRTYPLYLVQCEQCWHVQCPVVVDPALLFSEYSYASGVSASFRSHLASLAEECSSLGDTIVDIGSNDGTLVNLCAQEHMRALGIDPARNLAAEASRSGALTIPAFFDETIAKSVSTLFDCQVSTVTALNVFAHADDLGAIARGAATLIEPDGTFIFEVAYLLDLLRKNEFGSCYHEHLSHHHIAPLVEFLDRNGLHLEWVERVSAQGGSIRCYARHGSREPSPIIRAMIDSERAELPELLKAWPKRVHSWVMKTAEQLRPYMGDLAIYGAPARFNTVAYALGLQRDDVACVFDDEPRKVGRFTPGMQWPIVSSSELMKRNPPAVFIAAWPYAREIITRFPNYQGRWIVAERQ